MAIQTISEFKSSFKTDVSRQNRFDVIVSSRDFMKKFNVSSDFVRNIRLRCETAELPGRSLMTHDQKIYGYTEKYPYLSSYNDLNLTFIVGEELQERYFFDDWLRYIQSTDSFNFKYKKQYSTEIQITQYDQKNKVQYVSTLYRAYPIAVNQLDLDWSSDNYHKLTVVFAYDYWE